MGKTYIVCSPYGDEVYNGSNVDEAKKKLNLLKKRCQNYGYYEYKDKVNFRFVPLLPYVIIINNKTKERISTSEL